DQWISGSVDQWISGSVDQLRLSFFQQLKFPNSLLFFLISDIPINYNPLTNTPVTNPLFSDFLITPP
ncbi:hypothetical protein, partial [uncultured Roseivirga sp.]|uniref:hypothetical protein n=1 Tax=uncultured Roseivirga sp. TaxID=543088 RepID=UPI0030D9E733